MKKIRMVVELEYEEDIMHGNDKDSEEWFRQSVLGDPELSLFSNEIGDTVGTIRVIDLPELA